MVTKAYGSYIVYDRKTGQKLAEGNSLECAAALGLTYGSYMSAVCKSRKGLTPYRIVRMDDAERKQRDAKKWDDAFGWYRVRQMPYPCTGCMKAASCDYDGQVCDAWRRWFTANYDSTARQLRAALRKEAQCRNND